MQVRQRLRFSRKTPEQEGRERGRADGLRLALIYGVVAGVWVGFSDRLLVVIDLPRDVALFISAIKGQAFVIVTATILYFVATRHLNRLYTSEERHARLFEHATEGLTLFRVIRDDDGKMRDLVVEDVNPTQSARLDTPRAQLLGRRMSGGASSERVRTYFDLVRQSVEIDSPVRGEYAEKNVDELIATYPIEPDLWAVASMDITEVRQAQEALRAKDEWIRDAYVDVLDAVTGGKLLLLSEEEIGRELGERISDVAEVHLPEEVGAARRAVRDVVAARNPDLASSLALQNPLGEALNNVVKHAGGGEYATYARGSTIQLWVADRGPGIDFRTLPKAVLIDGFSTASTLGMGFTIMLQLCDRVLISTSPGRTIFVLEVSSHHAEAEAFALESSANP
jgi:anti-sigma regulatory factor (Ser/Thr protein kinase)